MLGSYLQILVRPQSVKGPRKQIDAPALLHELALTLQRAVPMIQENPSPQVLALGDLAQEDDLPFLQRAFEHNLVELLPPDRQAAPRVKPLPVPNR